MSASLQTLRELQEQGSLQPVDFQFADFIRRAAGSEDPGLLLAAALVSRSVGAGDVCLDLSDVAGRRFPAEADKSGREGAEGAASALKYQDLPALDSWLFALRTDAARKCVGGPEAGRPLVLDGSRLYLRRFWTYERQVVAALVARACAAGEDRGAARLEERLRQYFPEEETPGADLQRDAARKACSRRLAFISGGPGTGKTFTVARIVALLAEREPADRPLKVHLAAPTGKAAARVEESIRRAKAQLRIDGAIAAQIPDTASTLHRLLGAIPGSPYFRHNRSNPVDADVVVVDEASMIDLPVMAKLLDALPAAARLILVGDMDQLASVEPGRVFGDICDAAASHPVLRECMTRLTRSYRFSADSAIGRFSAAIHLADADEAWAALTGESHAALRRFEAGQGLRDGDGHPRKAFRAAVLAGYREFLDATVPAEVFRSVNAFRVLCAVRGGPFGVRAVNRIVEEVLSLRGVDAIEAGLRPGKPLAPSGEFYDHRLILVTANDYSQGLYNGDIGVVLAEPGSGSLYAWFEREAAGGAGEPYRRIAVNMLPAHDTAFAMTVHKSQGSEFGSVLLVLPPDAGSPVLTRELLYTGLTRTQGPLDLWCTEAAFKAAVSRRTRRMSGLKDRLAEINSAAGPR